jgi:hypothetical protein
VGKFTYNQNTLEGIEHGNPPHKIGVSTQCIHATVGSIVTNYLLAAPSDPTHKLCVTDLLINVDATTTVTISDGSYAEGHYIFRASCKPASSTSQLYVIPYSTPHVFSGVNRGVYFTQTAGANVDISVHYYETET